MSLINKERREIVKVLRISVIIVHCNHSLISREERKREREETGKKEEGKDVKRKKATYHARGVKAYLSMLKAVQGLTILSAFGFSEYLKESCIV